MTVLIGRILFILMILVIGFPYISKIKFVKEIAGKFKVLQIYTKNVIYLLIGTSILLIVYNICAIGYADLRVIDKCRYCALYGLCFNVSKNVYNDIGYKVGVEFFNMLYQYSLIVFPTFIISCYFAGIVVKCEKNILPQGKVSSFIAAAVIPVCSCGVLPLIYGFMSKKEIKNSVIIVFLITAPMLNPYTIFLSWSLLGTKYLILRIGAVFIISFLAGKLMDGIFNNRRLLISKGLDNTACNLCSALNQDGGILSFTAETIKRLIRPLIFGIILGAGLFAFFPTQFIDKYLGGGISGLFTCALIGLPLNICGGSEILILKPLLALGVAQGHAITFTIASTGICLSVFPLLISILGKKITIWLTLYLFFFSILIGYVINLFF